MFLALALLGCNGSDFEDREPGDRTPLSASCDPLDETRCHLPWPSNAFTVVDPDSATGLRLAIDEASLPVEDRATYANVADGFSRVTGVAFGLKAPIDPAALDWDPAGSLGATSPVQVLCAEPGHADYGRRMAYRTEAVDGSSVDADLFLVIGRPVEVLPENADHVAVLLDTIGTSEPTPRLVRVAMGLDEPEDDAEEEIAAWYAPTRAVVAEAGIDPERVLRVTEFTTRSHGNVTARIRSMMADLDAAVDGLEVAVDSATVSPAPELALIVRGRLLDAPAFVDEDGYLSLDAEGLPEIVGTAPIEFRLSVPAGTGDYRIVLYGHGTGGDVTDDAFDRELGGEGIAKLNLKYTGWTGEDLVYTLMGFTTFLDGSERSTAGLMQALAGGTALMTALDGPIGEIIAAETIAGQPNPAAGRHPDTSDIAWVGGSMGGTMGAVIVSADDRFHTAVLNVPGSGWTHMVPYSLLYQSGLGSMMMEQYDDLVDLQLAMVMAQGSWDDVDGGPWADEALASGGAFLLQESMEDPILPNLGTELLASALHAIQLDPALQDVHDLPHTADTVSSGATLTQFRVPDTGQYDVHGFAARDTPAGEAALGQILEFLSTSWAGDPVMRFPDGCAVTDDGSCDFSGMWD